MFSPVFFFRDPSVDEHIGEDEGDDGYGRHLDGVGHESFHAALRLN